MLFSLFCLICGQSFGHDGLLGMFKTGQNKENKWSFHPPPGAPGCTSMQILPDRGSQLSCCKPNVLSCTAKMNRITLCQFSKSQKSHVYENWWKTMGRFVLMETSFLGFGFHIGFCFRAIETQLSADRYSLAHVLPLAVNCCPYLPPDSGLALSLQLLKFLRNYRHWNFPAGLFLNLSGVTNICSGSGKKFWEVIGRNCVPAWFFPGYGPAHAH